MNAVPFQLELPFTKPKTYLWAGTFILANILFPQAFHAIPLGGKIFLPLFFFTLLASARFGWKAGLLTAVASPIISSLLFGMPPLALLPGLLVKGVILSATAALLFKQSTRFKWSLLALVILVSQAIGLLTDAVIFSNFHAAWSTVALSWPGLLLQLIGGGIILHQMDKRTSSSR